MADIMVNTFVTVVLTSWIAALIVVLLLLLVAYRRAIRRNR